MITILEIALHFTFSLKPKLQLASHFEVYNSTKSQKANRIFKLVMLPDLYLVLEPGAWYHAKNLRTNSV